MASLIERPPADTTIFEPKLRLIIEAVKKGVSTQIKAEMLATLTESAAAHRPTGASMGELQEHWRLLLPEFRILCLTESPAHSAMWFHYADQYRGAVLEFRCDDELDSAWRVARPVTYGQTKADVYTADGWANLLTMRSELAVKRLFDVATYTKAPDWSYESEWRIATFKRPNDTGLCTDYKFYPQELKSIYLGPLISEVDRSALVAAAAGYPDTRVFKVALGMTREFIVRELSP